MEKEEQRFVMKFLWLEGWGAKRIHEELMNILGDDSYRVSQIKIWLQKFRSGDLSCKDSPRSGRPLLTLESQLEVFMQKYPFTSARVIARHFLTMVPTIKDILQRELGVKKILAGPGASFSQSHTKSCSRRSIKTILRVLQDAESNDFEGIATGDEFWFRYCYPSSTMFARAPFEVIPRRGKQLARKKQ
jgi:hypothetical protein